MFEEDLRSSGDHHSCGGFRTLPSSPDIRSDSQRPPPRLLAAGRKRHGPVFSPDLLQRNVPDAPLPDQRGGHDIRHPARRRRGQWLFRFHPLRQAVDKLLGAGRPARQRVSEHQANLRDSLHPQRPALRRDLLQHHRPGLQGLFQHLRDRGRGRIHQGQQRYDRRYNADGHERRHCHRETVHQLLQPRPDSQRRV
jgi:hypothetical protein